jgi:hypothetical protein
LNTVAEDEAVGDVAELYLKEIEEGFLPNFARIFSLHPEAFRGWRHLRSHLQANGRPPV